ncbi:transcriptional regulator, LysR family [Paenibacillus curdlanolyticus YK9]|uniref:Transcriptional regulator, LysR family n=1 Tax=Paenibacillus curdlanolyticus YK9 TaxID=717606 RepID=E0IF10_9BACL|nr:LysR family transcriptional regulator [Paenibacillus curdlanolyticus]EFM08786.1 transcriptional regulator, LysR family [Paenibacillus curdlanolyticus YK9]
MEINQLEYFLTVANLQHVTRAAESLSITQPALSHSLAKLEEELGVPLFERTGRTVQLNRYGRLFASRVTDALREIRVAKEELAELTAPESGIVSLAFGTILGTQFVPELIQKFHVIYPNIRFELYQGSCSHTLQALENGQCDLSITSPRSGKPGIAWETLVTADLYVVVPASHRYAQLESITLEQLADEPFIEVNKTCGLRATIDSVFQLHSFQPKVAYTTEDLHTVAGFVAAGLGVSLLPQSRGLRLEGTHWLKVNNPGCVCEVGIEWKEKRYLSPSARLFRAFAQEHYRQRVEM